MLELSELFRDARQTYWAAMAAAIATQAARSGRHRYGVLCLSICNIIIKRETTKAWAISCSSLSLLRTSSGPQGVTRCGERLGGLLKYYSRTG